jgi:hypothetical protein
MKEHNPYEEEETQIQITGILFAFLFVHKILVAEELFYSGSLQPSLQLVS